MGSTDSGPAMEGAVTNALPLFKEDHEPDSASSADESDGRNEATATPVASAKQAENFRLFNQQIKTQDPTTTENSKSANEVKQAQEAQAIIHKAREYQQELYERAKAENIVAVLDTGTGKTLIAAMLIRDVLQQEVTLRAETISRRIVFFLANSVPLVHQQARFLKNNLLASVEAIWGHCSIDVWDPVEWEKLLVEHDVIVCTAEILRNALFRRFVTLQKISLIIFDEAHHCVKEHPYSKIIRDYYLKANHPRPRLFGMTASPVNSKKDIAEGIKDLEDLLHSKVVTTEDASLFGFAHTPADAIWPYTPLRPSLRMEDEMRLYQTLKRNEVLLSQLHPEFDVARSASYHLGTWFANYLLHRIVNKREVAILIHKFELTKAYADLDAVGKTNAIQALHDAVGAAEYHPLSKLRLEEPLVSPKVQTLYQELERHFAANEAARVMVFVEEKWTAVLLYECFRTLNRQGMRSGLLTGGGQSGREAITSKKQEEVVRLFHAGLVNILFTTSVGEEGIDIPRCNLVVRFDSARTPIQYMQTRGRARMKDSVFAHLLSTMKPQERNDLQYFIDTAIYLKAYCQTLPKDRLLGQGTKLKQLIAKDSINKSFETTASVVCNFSNCMLILSRYASSLRHVGALTSEVYEEIIVEGPDRGFQYVVHLPPAENGCKIKKVKGEPRQNKALAKRDAAFKCVSRLRAENFLDENLDSICKKVKPENANAHLAVSAKRDSYGMKLKPDLWQQGLGTIPAELYAVLIAFEPVGQLKSPLSNMVLFMRGGLPELPVFQLYLEDGVEVCIRLQNLPRPLSVSREQLDIITAYTLNAVFDDVFHKVYEYDTRKLYYWLTPAKGCVPSEVYNISDIVDMPSAQRAQQTTRKWSNGTAASLWCNQFLLDPLSGSNRYFTEAVVDQEGVNVFSPIPREFLPKAGRKRNAKNVMHFTDSHWREDERNKLAKKMDSDQPVLLAVSSGTRRNFLDKTAEHEKYGHKCWVAPGPLQIARLAPSAARSALTFPSIIHRIESYLIVLEGVQKVGLPQISPELALEAFTKDDNTDDPEDQIHGGRVRGMGKNYERLEFIGDSFLKMTTTITVFNRTTCDEEGMHCRRMEILCNRRLFTVATETFGLFKYIRSKSFDRDNWYPEWKILKGRQPRRPQPAHQLGMKTIADVCEATIGAAVCTTKSHPIETRSDLGIKAVTALVESEDHKVASWGEFAAMYTAPGWQKDMDDPVANDLARRIEKSIGYRFQYPRLVRSAFTHSSDMTSPVPDLQRLEFLGDACLDWVCIWWLFDTNPERNPQWLTEHKMAMVSNKFLAALAVTLDFDKCFSINTTALASAIFTYATEIRETLAQPDYPPDFWTRIDAKPPKALSDLVESTLGAMLIDSGFQLEYLEAFFHTHVKKFFADISLYDGFANRHPTSYIYKKLTDEYGCSEFSVLASDVQDGAIETKITAGVLIHGKVVSRADGTSAKYAKVRASQAALQLLDGIGRKEFRERFGCDCKRGEMMEAAAAASAAEERAMEREQKREDVVGDFLE